MIKLIKKSLLIVAVLTTVVMTGNEVKSNVTFKLIDAKLVDLSLKNNDGELKVSVKDSKGEILHSQYFEGSLFTKKYDFKNLPQGEYFFEIDGQTKVEIMPFEVTSKAILFNNKVEMVYYKPVVKQEGDLILISKQTNIGESISVLLYDIDDTTVLFGESIISNGAIDKRLNIKKLRAGKYKLVVKGENKIHSEYIKK